MNKTYQGTVKTFNGQFGFLKSELGDTYFNKSGIVGNISIDKGDEVEFKTEPSLKKEGSLQCCEITLIKKFEKPSIQLVNPILGILKWFNEEKGFGIIATPEKSDYILHKSNFNAVNLSPKTGDALVFEENTEKGKKVASNCKAVRDYEDLKIALEYLFKDDNVIIEVKVAKRGYRGKIHYSKQNKNISLLTQAVFQILKDKTIDVRFKFISDYFRDKLADKPSEEQLKYFNFIKSISSYQNPFKEIFEKLTDPKEQDTVLKESLEIIGIIDNEEKYSRVNSLASLSELDENVKERFLLTIINECNIHYQVKQFLDYLQFRKGNKQQQLINLFKNLDIISFYSFCLELLNPLAKINTHYYNNGYSFLKIYLEKKDYIIETNNKYGYSSIFSYKGVLLNESLFEAKIEFFRTISLFIEGNLNKIEESAKSIIETGDFELISKFLKNYHSFYQVNNQICFDLQINVSIFPDIESYIVDLCDTAQLLKFWVNGLIEYFNFNTYCFYYFTLSLEERKIFNKKAKAKMGEEIKASMLKKREPWQFVEKVVLEDNIEIEIYTASWKSIWFGDGFIRVCMDSKPSFSQQFKWDFSEEKFNFLYEYISGKRLNELKITATGDFIKSVQDLDELEEIIWKILIIKEVETTNGTTIRGTGSNRIPVNMLLRNQCIQLLNKFQLKELEPSRVLEKTFNPIKGGMGVDVSLLYSIPINEYEVAIIWESLELEKAKATHIFKCLRTEYENIFSEIENYLSGNLKVRSSLNSKDADAISQQNKLRYLCRIEHDNFNFSKWEKSLYEILPELKLLVSTDE